MIFEISHKNIRYKTLEPDKLMFKDTLLRGRDGDRERKRWEKKPAHIWIRTNNFLIAMQVLYHCATTAATAVIFCDKVLLNKARSKVYA